MRADAKGSLEVLCAEWIDETRVLLQLLEKIFALWEAKWKWEGGA